MTPGRPALLAALACAALLPPVPARSLAGRGEAAAVPRGGPPSRAGGLLLQKAGALRAHTLLTDLTGAGAGAGAVGAGSRLQREPRGADFFEDDMQEMGPESPNISTAGCHPKCTWECGKKECNAKCKPVCKPPKCMTACEKPKISECRQMCEDPHCAVVCPSAPPSASCETGRCPGCQAVCGKPACRLDCGQGRLCKSTCAEPECAWKCEPGSCPEPDCRMRCDTPKQCSLGPKEPTLREEYAGHGADALQGLADHAAEYAGREVTWKGLAAVSADQMPVAPLVPVGPQPLGSAQPATGASMPEFAKPASDEPCADFCGKGAPAPAPAPGLAPSPAPCLCKDAEDVKVSKQIKWVVVART